MIWIEVESQISSYRVRTFRGLADESQVEQLLKANGDGFLILEDCYWYNDADDEAEEGKVLGSYQRLGHKEYANFVGKIAIRFSTVLNLAYLKGGYDNEPIIRGV